MTGVGHIDGREIDALTINADEFPTVLTIDGGYRICLKPGRTRVTLMGNLPFAVPASCIAFAVPASRSMFTVPAKRGCAI